MSSTLQLSTPVELFYSKFSVILKICTLINKYFLFELPILCLAGDEITGKRSLSVDCVDELPHSQK